MHRGARHVEQLRRSDIAIISSATNTAMCMLSRVPLGAIDRLSYEPPVTAASNLPPSW